MYYWNNEAQGLFLNKQNKIIASVVPKVGFLTGDARRGGFKFGRVVCRNSTGTEKSMYDFILMEVIFYRHNILK